MKKEQLITNKDYEKNIELFGFQKEALDKFQNILESQNHKRFYFGLKMGLGKTYASLQWFKQNNVKNFFIITKPILLNQWAKNYVHIFKDENFEILNKAGDEAKPFDNPNKVYICSYDKIKKIFQKDQEAKIIKTDKGFKSLSLPSFNIILDESQVLKSHKSQISKAFLKQNDKINYLSLLSGSAISNDLDGLYVQYSLLRDTTHFSYYDFIRKYFNVGQNKFTNFDILGPKQSMLPTLLDNFGQYAFFKDPKEVLDINDVNMIRLGSFQNEDDKENIFKINRQYLRQKAIFEPSLNFLALLDSPLNTTAKIRQLLSGFVYGIEIDNELKNALLNFDVSQKDNAQVVFDSKENNQIKIETDKWDLNDLKHKTLIYKQHPKFDLLNEKLKDEENYVVFYNFDAEKEIINKIALDNGYTTYQINGNQNDLDLILKDKAKSKRMVIAQIQAASQGIDGLQENYHNIIHYSLPYSYEHFSQANARLYRQGQKKNVDIYYLVCHPLEDLQFKRLELYKDYGDLVFYQDLANFFKKYENIEFIKWENQIKK